MRVRNKQRDHERYMENREKILEQQRIYRETHKEEIKAKRRQRDFERRYLNNPKPPPKTRKELDHDYYMRHRKEIIAKAIARNKQKNYERREQYKPTTTDGDSRVSAR